MTPRREYQYAEVPVDKLLLESFANEQSPYYSVNAEQINGASLGRFRTRLNWHIKRSLSKRQKQVIEHYLKGKTERDIARILGITQQVVNIYKHRAIKKLQRVIAK